MRAKGVSLESISKGVLKLGVYSLLVINDLVFMLDLFFSPEDHNFTLTEWVMFALFMVSLYLLVKEVEKEEAKEVRKNVNPKRTHKSL